MTVGSRITKNYRGLVHYHRPRLIIPPAAPGISRIMATFIPRRFRPTGAEDTSQPSWLRRQVTSILSSASTSACVHPIHTIVIIALLASTTYIGLLEGSIFDVVRTTDGKAGQLDLKNLFHGSRNLRLGERTSWHWQIEDNVTAEADEVCLSLLALIKGREKIFFFFLKLCFCLVWRDRVTDFCFISSQIRFLSI